MVRSRSIYAPGSGLPPARNRLSSILLTVSALLYVTYAIRRFMREGASGPTIGHVLLAVVCMVLAWRWLVAARRRPPLAEAYDYQEPPPDDELPPDDVVALTDASAATTDADRVASAPSDSEGGGSHSAHTTGR